VGVNTKQHRGEFKAPVAAHVICCRAVIRFSRFDTGADISGRVFKACALFRNEIAT
jgi:hypothetical protein